MASTSGFQRVPGWYKPDDEPSDTASSGSTSAQPPPQSQSNGSTGQRPRTQRTHWPPRQCRICLETVQPTFNVPSQHLPGFLQSSRVVYEDESGRLLRPCNCKGSSKYVHEFCLKQWRHADPRYGQRNFWQCPTCGFKYKFLRLGIGRFIGGTAAQITLTAIILMLTIFVLGFIADPIINLYLDPWSILSPFSGWSRPEYAYYDDEEATTWYEHFAKGLASMGVLGFLKVLLASPLHYFRLGGGRNRNTGRDRYEQVSWIIILIGVGTFLVAVYKGVRVWTRRVLETAGERVMDVQGDDDDDQDG